MKAAVYYGRHDVRVEWRPDPPAPGPQDVILKVRLAGICGTDAKEYSHGPILVTVDEPHPVARHVGPLILGHEFCGEVVDKGRDVKDFEVGDLVVPGAGISCGQCLWCRQGRTNLCERYVTLGLQLDGGLAEYCLSPAAICRHVPAGCADEAAAMAQPLAVAVHALRRGKLEPGETALIIGSGGIGAFLIQAARALGAERIFVAEVAEPRKQLAAALGAETVLDPKSIDIVEAVRDLTNGTGPDIVVEASGAPTSPMLAANAVRNGGRVVMLGLQPKPIPIEFLPIVLREVDFIQTVAHVCDQDLPVALEFLASSRVRADLLEDRRISLDAIVDEGLAPLSQGEVIGPKVLIDPTS